MGKKKPEEMEHRDELLFQTVHQSSELWLKLAAFETDGPLVGRVMLDLTDDYLRVTRRARGRPGRAPPPRPRPVGG